MKNTHDALPIYEWAYGSYASLREFAFETINNERLINASCKCVVSIGFPDGKCKTEEIKAESFVPKLQYCLDAYHEVNGKVVLKTAPNVELQKFLIYAGQGFNTVIEKLLENGNDYVAYREGWNGKGMFVFLRSNSFVDFESAKKINTIDSDVIELLIANAKQNNQSQLHFLPSLSLATANKTIINGWQPNQLDLLTMDWQICKASDFDLSPFEYKEVKGDAYHTMDELYNHRHALFLNLCAAANVGWCSLLHDDGTMYDGYFIAGAELPTGQITYHLPMTHWETARQFLKELNRAPAWDGANSFDVLERLEKNLHRKD